MTIVWLLPLVTFAALAVLERRLPSAHATSPSARADYLLNLAGLTVQGIGVPLAGYFIATGLLAVYWPNAAGVLHIGWLGAFALNFIMIDFLYYWQHRLFHRLPALWALHECHHASPFVNVWATSRNSLAVNFIFVYMLFNPLFGFLCDRPDGFFAAAALTASLDIWRHSRLPEQWTSNWLTRILVTPARHHDHHSPDGQATNFGANFILWDKLFGTARECSGYPKAYGAGTARSPWRQFLFPW